MDRPALPLPDSFKSEAYDNWFKDTPSDAVHREDIQEYVFKEVNGGNIYSDDDCAGKSFQIKTNQCGMLE